MICNSCGNWHDGGFGSGKFCSRSCANRRNHTTITKQKISKTLKGKRYGNAILERYFSRLSQCPICHKIKKIRSRIENNEIQIKTCSKKCFHKYLKLRIKESGTGGYREHSGYGKSGYYKGIYCASTYELIFLAYNVEIKNKIERCKLKFEYFYKGKKHLYYPDFEINGILYEIKGYKTEKTKLKIESVKNKGIHIKLLFLEDLLYMKQFLQEKFNFKNITELYDPVD